MVDILESQKKGFGSHGGLQHTVSDSDIQPIGKRVLVCKMRFGDIKTRGGIILLDDDEKFKDDNENTVEIETRGVRTPKGIYFLASDVSKVFEMPNLYDTLNDDR